MNVNDFLAHEINRRKFLGASAVNAAGMAAGMVGIHAGAAAVAAMSSDVLRLGIIGVRSQGQMLALESLLTGEALVAAICDVDESVLRQAALAIEQRQGLRPRCESDFRHLLDDPQLDAVLIATPDHWHAMMTLLAVQAGKDVYLEVPVSHTIAEGQRLVEVVSQSGSIVQCGLQQRSGTHFQSAVRLVRSGQLGTVRLAKAWSAVRRKALSPQGDTPTPPGVDYDQWLGPAVARPFNANRFHHHWNRYWDYGSGELGTWGIHLLDIARWGLGLELPVRVSATGGLLHLGGDQQTPDTLLVNYEYPHGLLQWEHRQWSSHGNESRHTGLAFYGDRGTLVVDRSGWKVYDCQDKLTADASELKQSHLRNFFAAVRTRRSPVADLVTGHLSSTLCHLGNIAYRLGRDISVDPQTPDLVTSPEAVAFVRSEYRRPYTLPTG